MSRLPAQDVVFVGVDVGGTKIHAAAFDAHYTIVAQTRLATVTGGASAVAGSLASAVEDICTRVRDFSIASVGMGVPGLVDRASGSVKQAVNLGLGDEAFEIVKLIDDRFGIPAAVDNDVNAAALGAFELLGGPGLGQDLAFLGLGTGVAAGVVINGELFHGHRGVAGEIGHVQVAAAGPLCACGLTGCWPIALGRPRAAEVFSAALAGHPAALAEVADFADYLARAVYLLAVAYDIDQIVIGGGASEIGVPLIGVIRMGLARLERQSGFVRSLGLRDRVRLAPDGPVGTIGAAAIARHHFAIGGFRS